MEERARTEGGEGDDQGVREPHREDRLAEVPVQALGRSVVERVLGGVLGGIYSALEDAVSAIEGSESPNLRSLSKMRPVLVG